ncbi:MAG: YqcI/YcgG family protein [Porphyrobacter sp.]|nr:YqcI/YcgG family protein [Porphyrobacter sp.]
MPRPRLVRGLTGLIEQEAFPCVGAKAALGQGGLEVLTAGSITAARDDRRIHARLVEWSAVPDEEAAEFRSLAVVFEGPRDLDERGFERALWQRIGALIAADRRRGFAPHGDYSENPAHPDFALSFGGKAYFAVGLHPHASRRARRAPNPAIVFNLHEQFAKLRAEGRYERMREVILARDEAFDGTPNPMIARHGVISEARQYSGREVEEGWTCPLAPPETRP